MLSRGVIIQDIDTADTSTVTTIAQRIRPQRRQPGDSSRTSLITFGTGSTHNRDDRKHGTNSYNKVYCAYRLNNSFLIQPVKVRAPTTLSPVSILENGIFCSVAASLLSSFSPYEVEQKLFWRNIAILSRSVAKLPEHFLNH